jgi:3-hydroxyacyl-[acyl-carrier-protein] dehydratase
MRLKDSLYTICRQTADGADIRYEIRLDGKHVIYQAHFPGEPITPGVCIIQTANELLEDYLHRRLELRTVKNVKFLGVISPRETPCVTYTFDRITPDEETHEWKAQVAVSSEKGVLAKLSFVSKV